MISSSGDEDLRRQIGEIQKKNEAMERDQRVKDRESKAQEEENARLRATIERLEGAGEQPPTTASSAGASGPSPDVAASTAGGGGMGGVGFGDRTPARSGGG